MLLPWELQNKKEMEKWKWKVVNTLKPVSLSLTLCSFHINYCRRTVKSTQKRLHFKWNSFHFIVILIKNSYFTGLLLYALHHAEQWKKFDMRKRKESIKRAFTKVIHYFLHIFTAAAAAAIIIIIIIDTSVPNNHAKCCRNHFCVIWVWQHRMWSTF